jgi:hypothetical protein
VPDIIDRDLFLEAQEWLVCNKADSRRNRERGYLTGAGMVRLRGHQLTSCDQLVALDEGTGVDSPPGVPRSLCEVERRPVEVRRPGWGMSHGQAIPKRQRLKPHLGDTRRRESACAHTCAPACAGKRPGNGPSGATSVAAFQESGTGTDPSIEFARPGLATFEDPTGGGPLCIAVNHNYP